MRVLLVDDEEQLVSTLAERLAFRGIHANWVTSSTAALELIETDSFDLAILDVKMPKISGLGWTRRPMVKRCRPCLRWPRTRSRWRSWKAGAVKSATWR